MSDRTSKESASGTVSSRTPIVSPFERAMRKAAALRQRDPKKTDEAAMKKKTAKKSKRSSSVTKRGANKSSPSSPQWPPFSKSPLTRRTYDDDECEDNGVAEWADGSPVVSSRLPISFGLHNIYVTSKKTTKIVGVIVSCSSTRIGCAPSMNSVASS